MVRNFAIGNKGPKRNLFPFVSQMQTTDFYGNFGTCCGPERPKLGSLPKLGPTRPACLYRTVQTSVQQFEESRQAGTELAAI